jgi:hypothetical protein
MSALRDPRHETFAREVAGGNSLRGAWVTAGFGEASRNWARLARKVTVARRIADLRTELNAAAGIHLRYVQEKLLGIIGADLTQYFEQDEYGLRVRKDLHDMPAELRAAISELKIDKDGRVTLKLESKGRAIDALLKTIPGAVAATKTELSLSLEELIRASMALREPAKPQGALIEGQVAPAESYRF